MAIYGNPDMEQLIFHIRTVLVDTIVSLCDSDGRVIPVVEVHEFLTKIHDILDSAVSKWVGNIPHFWPFFFNSSSTQHNAVWASKYSFLNNLKESVPPSEAYLYGHISWSLA